MEALAHERTVLPACPICASANLRVERSVTAHEAAQHFVLRESEPERHGRLASQIRELWGRDTAELRHCSDCEFGFAWPFVGGDAEFYEMAFGPSGYPKWRWEFDRSLAALEGGEYANALEVGAGYGFFLDRLRPRVPAARLHALEYNSAARVILERKGYTSSGTDLRDLRGQTFDLLFMFQVLEHLDRPDEIFAAIARLLNRNGRAFVSVPNAARIAWWHEHGGLLDMPPNHIGRWTPSAFERMALRHGLAVADHEVSPYNSREFLKADAINAFLRKTQKSGSLANRLAAGGRRGKQLGAMMYAPARILANLGAQPGGDALWVELRHSPS